MHDAPVKHVRIVCMMWNNFYASTACTVIRGATTFSKLGVQCLGLRYYYLIQKKLDRFTQFGGVGYIITLYSSKSYVKSWGVRPNFGEVRTPGPPVVAPKYVI